jgi:hypothetical protein
VLINARKFCQLPPSQPALSGTLNLTGYKKKSGTQTYSVNTVDKTLEILTNTSLFKKFSFFYGI